ncbi:GMC family oxidoreductase [Streptomyces sp. SKN60]|uniref:GMC family oxidoreductase n=1 Tax=Streptomyces sp. SKN60 TaxID=2855506 RepID=UPI002246E2F3|nr:GMC family oxidoreductase [Streptomyces sp. SKN60]MCX2185000.1 GMC family oxidoreductase [Streptomyces sp. SKN60]
MSTALCDVVVIGSGFGGAIPAYYAAAAGARVVVLERGPRLGAADFTHDLQLSSVSRIVDVIQGDGLTGVAGNCVGGSSVVYFAASLRAPSFAFDRSGGTGRRLWPAALTRVALDPYYDRVEQALPVSTQTWNDVSYAGGLFAAACHHTGHTANPVPLAVDLSSCTDCNWMLNGCRFDAKRSMLLNYLPAAEAHGAVIRPLHEVQALSPALTPGYRYRVTYTTLDADDYRLPTGAGCIEARVVVLAAGALATPVILKRSAPLLGGIPAAVGRHLSGNGDRVSVAIVDEAAAGTVLGLHRTADKTYDAHHIGKGITAMTFDYLDADRPEHQRFSLQQLAFPALTNMLATTAGTHRWYGAEKKNLRAAWRSWLTVLAMTEDDGEGMFSAPPPTGSFLRVGPGLGIGSFRYAPGEGTRAGWASADHALRDILETDGIATVEPWAEQPGGALTTHPLGSCRLGDDPATSALTLTHELRDHPSLYITDASAVPAALTVNPALTVAALAERASEHILQNLTAQGLTTANGVPVPGS